MVADTAADQIAEETGAVQPVEDLQGIVMNARPGQLMFGPRNDSRFWKFPSAHPRRLQERAGKCDNLAIGPGAETRAAKWLERET